MSHSHDDSHHHSHGHSHEHVGHHVHEHSHEHGNPHDHDHSHAHSHDVVSPLSFEEKMFKLLSHWIKHNDDHEKNYIEWAEKANASGLAEIGTLLTEAAQLTRSVSTKFEAALSRLGKRPL